MVPNRYYAFSGYETTRLDNRIKFVNLPQTCTISIYMVSGTLVRKYSKDNDLTFLDWDLKNASNIPFVGRCVHLSHRRAWGRRKGSSSGSVRYVPSTFRISKPTLGYNTDRDDANDEWKAMVAVACMALTGGAVLAGNPDRAGSAGATPALVLILSPRSSGWGLANSASVRGVEAMYGNIAGLAHVNRTEVVFANTRWLSGSGTTINSIGFAQKMGSSGVLGISATTLGFGDLPVTTVVVSCGWSGKFLSDHGQYR